MIRKSREHGIDAVQEVNLVKEFLVVRNVLKVMIFPEVGVESHGREAPKLAAGIKEPELLNVRIAGDWCKNSIDGADRAPNVGI